MNAEDYWPLLQKLDLFDSMLQSFLNAQMDGYRTWMGSEAYPPCMIPLWSSFGQITIGYWNHWIDDRSGTFVVYSWEAGGIRECAKSVDELKEFILIQLWEVWEEISPEVETAAQLLDVDFAQLFDESSVPQDRVESLYIPPMPYDATILRGHCSFEVDSDKARKVKNTPAWLASDSQRDLFDEYEGNNDLSSSWLSLCSSRWRAHDAAVALNKIVNEASNKMLTEYAKIYCRHFSENPNPY